jgi:nucleotide-binding universal stress UspA family protein
MTTPLNTIAVGYDGSEPATVAVRWAFAVAGQIGADVVLVHAVGLLSRLEGQSASSDLLRSVHRLAAEVGLAPTRWRWHVTDGDACSVLLRAADEPIAADLLVVGSRGQSVHAGLLLGSTSLQLAERSRVPLVIVPSGRGAS